MSLTLRLSIQLAIGLFSCLLVGAIIGRGPFAVFAKLGLGGSSRQPFADVQTSLFGQIDELQAGHFPRFVRPDDPRARFEPVVGLRQLKAHFGQNVFH